MPTPNEVLTKKCHQCEVDRPLSDFIRFVSGKKKGQIGCDCIRCWSGQSYAPRRCESCGELRARCDYDKSAEGGKVCKECLETAPDSFLKRCSECENKKPVSSFYRVSRTSYISPVCKKCQNTVIATAKRKRKGSAKIAAEVSRYMQSVKAEAYEAYGGYRCACCGETEKTFLTLDHINDDGATWRRSLFGGANRGAGLRTYTWCKKNGYPPIFQVLCWNCQHGKRNNGGICPHRKETRRDYPLAGVGSSDPKRLGSPAEHDIVQAFPKGKPVEPAVN